MYNSFIKAKILACITFGLEFVTDPTLTLSCDV